MMKILVVEDERLLADSLQTLLTGRGFSVDTANDGLTGLEYAKTDVYDLVILDVMMPGLDGYTVASRLRAEHHADADGKVRSHGPRGRAERRGGLLSDKAV